MQIHDNYAYVGVGAELVILGINTGSDLTPVGRLKLPATTLDIAVSNGYAYVAMAERGVWVVDVEDVTAPQVVSEYTMPANAESLAVSRERLYVGTARAGVWGLNITNPVSLSVAAVFEMGEATVSDLALTENTLYASTQQSWSGEEFVGSNGVYGLDISRPDAIQETGFYDTDDVPVLNIVVEGDTLYANAGWSVMPGSANAIKVVDVHDAEHLVEVGNINVGNWPISTIALKSQYLYITTQDCDYMYSGLCTGWLEVLDISDPSAPVQVGTVACPACDIPGFVQDLSLIGDRAYVAATNGGVLVYDITEPKAIQQVQTYTYPARGMGADVTVDNHYAFVATNYDGLEIIDIADPKQPVAIGDYENVLPTSVQVKENYAYVASLAGLFILDVTDPVAPQKVSFFDTPGLCWGVALSGTYAYVSDVFYRDLAGAPESVGLRVLDVSNPAAPLEKSFNHEIGGVWANPFILGDYLYTSGLEIASLANPTAPTLLSELPVLMNEGDTAVVVADHHAYIAAGDQGLRIIDIADPKAPVEIGAFNPPSAWLSDIELVDNLAYIAGGDLYIVDVSDPHNPVSVAVFDTPGSVNGISVVGDYLYVADGNAGLTILKVMAKQ